MGYKDKLKPISTTTPSYVAKLKPIAKPEEPQKPFFQRVVGDIKARGENVVKEITNTNQNPLLSGFKATAQGFGAIGDVFGEMIKSTPVVNKIAEKAGEQFQKATNPENKGLIQDLGRFIAKQEEKHPKAVQRTSNVLEGLSATGEIAGNILAAEGARQGAVKIAEVAPKIPDAIIGAPEKASSFINKLRTVSPGTQAKSINSLEQDYYKWSGQTKSGAKYLSKAEAKTEAMNRAGTSGKTPARTLSEDGIVPETQGTKFNTAEQAKTYRESVKPLNGALDDAVKQIDYSASPMRIDQLESAAIKRINGLKMPAGDKAALIDDIKSEYSLVRQKYGDTISATDMQLEKPNYWGGTKFDSTKPFKSDAYYQVAKSFQEGIENMAKSAGFDDVAQLNRIIGDKLEAAKYLESLNGNTLKYGKVGKYVFMGIGSTLGQGVVGKILGALGGEAVGELLMKASVSNPVKRLILSSIQKQSPQAYQEITKWLEKQGAMRDIIPKLPPGVTGQNVINQGRPIPVFPSGSKGEYTGPETVIQNPLGKLNPPK